ncbi:hypothetical protein GFD17_04455 [Bifidobacterium sp. SMB2]|uniref:Uncharacterized protein n=1 Tax=Bifidobacterium saimiriisciurei TaxID=2661627 RepID=A0ABX0C6W0_9BIFI|nr:MULTISPECIES: hypothetical protein [Bifidobacterium]NEG96021.1 hypothetical protein [Bifidobacterium sp. SMB2]NEH10901.1 hypothetical protein [Bifidobacterium saimiriisciurei]
MRLTARLDALPTFACGSTIIKTVKGSGGAQVATPARVGSWDPNTMAAFAMFTDPARGRIVTSVDYEGGLNVRYTSTAEGNARVNWIVVKPPTSIIA